MKRTMVSVWLAASVLIGACVVGGSDDSQPDEPTGDVSEPGDERPGEPTDDLGETPDGTELTGPCRSQTEYYYKPRIFGTCGSCSLRQRTYKDLYKKCTISPYSSTPCQWQCTGWMILAQGCTYCPGL